MSADPFQFVFPKYAFDNRHYHGINHITRMLGDAYRYGDHSKILVGAGAVSRLNDVLYEAILFHDIVWQPVSNDGISNEVLSADAYKKWAANCCLPKSPEHMTSVSLMIKATEFHFTDFVSNDYLTNLLLDLDIIGFADSYESFLNCQFLIDKEYLTVYDKNYLAKKRYQFLSNILEKQLLKFRVIDTEDYFKNKAYSNIRELLNEWDDLYNDE